MNPRALRVSPAAVRDLVSQVRLLRQERGVEFAESYAEAIIAWLERIAAGGAQLGTAVGSDPTLRVFGYRRQASIVARFSEGELRVMRIYFRGQDWSAGP